MPIPPRTEIEKKRAAWWAEHVKPGMVFEEIVRQNEELLALYPPTKAEREEKTRDLQAMPDSFFDARLARSAA
jgi:hypothetical protein